MLPIELTLVDLIWIAVVLICVAYVGALVDQYRHMKYQRGWKQDDS